MIKRISELSNVETFAKENGEKAQLSDCILEVSFTPDNGTTYKSGYMTGPGFLETIILDIQEKTLETITVCGEVTVKNGSLCVEHSTLNLLCGSSVIAWPNEDPSGKETYLCANFDHIKLCSDNEINIHSDGRLDLEGNPIVINNNLTVYTNSTLTTNSVNLTNTNNIVLAQSVGTDMATLNANPNRVVTCEMLRKTLSDVGDKVYLLDRGYGIAYKSSEIRSKLTTGTNDQTMGTVSPESREYVNGTIVEIEAKPNTGYYFDHWTGDLGGTINPSSVTMDSDKEVVAVFKETAELDYIQVSYTYDTSTGRITFTTNPTYADYNPKTATATSGTTVTYTFTASGYQDTVKSYQWTRNSSTKIWTVTEV